MMVIWESIVILKPPIVSLQAPENTTTYVIVLAQYIILAVVFNKGKPHRSPLYTNFGLLGALTAQVRWGGLGV